MCVEGEVYLIRHDEHSMNLEPQTYSINLMIPLLIVFSEFPYIACWKTETSFGELKWSCQKGWDHGEKPWPRYQN